LTAGSDRRGEARLPDEQPVYTSYTQNIAWLVEHHYPYLVASRKHHREFDPEEAVLIKETDELQIRAQRRVNTDTGEVAL
jgi:hypothetical protein